MNKIKLFWLVIATMFVSTACSPVPRSVDVLKIQNESSHEIKIKVAYNNVYIMIRPHESKTYTITWGMDSYMVNFDGLITTYHTHDDKNNPHSLGDFTFYLDLHTPTIDEHRHIYEFVFTDADYEYAVAHPFNHWLDKNWVDYISQ